MLDTIRFWDTMLDPNTIIFASNYRLEDRDSPALRDDLITVVVLEAIEKNGHRLIKLLGKRKNSGEPFWEGAWSDGSHEMTQQWVKLLDHKFGDHNVSWISYSDFLQVFNFGAVHQLFGPEWQVAKLWAAFEIPWQHEHLPDELEFVIKSRSTVLIVLSQLDPSFFRGLEGKYSFNIEFSVLKDGQRIAHARRRYSTQRSNSLKLELENGTYIVHPKITATRRASVKSVYEIINTTSQTRQEKLVKTALEYDLAYAQVSGWQALAKKADLERLERIKSREGLEPTVTQDDTSGQNSSTQIEIDAIPPPNLENEDALGFHDWNAVAALGLRIFTNGSVSTIELKRGQSSRGDHDYNSNKPVRLPPGTSFKDFDSSDDEGAGEGSKTPSVQSKTKAVS
jgi:hypothetical protein